MTSDRKSSNSQLESPAQQTLKPWWQKHAETIRIVAIAFVLAFLLRTFIVEPRFIPSGSMEPTLQIHDRIIVDKISYQFNQPQRGEILIFYPPASPFIEDTSKAYIKRLIGLPGDRISIQAGKVYVNDIAIEEPYIAEPPSYNFRGSVTVPPNSYWVMGDNRNNSNDSHVWGFLPKQNIVGRAVFRFWPLDNRLGEITTPKYSTINSAIKR
ncbi:signal peptidase I [Tumidithrix elongata RA019]|uniref:Signal peptidase I n=1 Tax=Tumidithrix elongata BACA0141 TaxID=2716417 RepID=A0AAW9Q9N3_9CYAN|nr:signal peptidase I [Tumidithrix elongata RA019]